MKTLLQTEESVTRRYIGGRKSPFHILIVARCPECKKRFWGKRLFSQMARIHGRPNYCSECTLKFMGKILPPYVRYLTDGEESALQSYYDLAEVTISFLDPSEMEVQ